MAKIVDSLKKLSVDHNIRKYNDNRTITKRRKELMLSAEERVSSEQNYVLNVCGTQSDPEFRIGTALSDHTCVIYSVGETVSQIATLTHNRDRIVGIKFSTTSKNILYTATNDGILSACDLRAKGKVIAEFTDISDDGKVKPLCSFDISSNERLLAGGTEHIGGDAFILFWDIRHNSKLYDRNTLLGGYWQSHLEDVTCLAFHPKNQDLLASGSTDGLINVFDLKQQSEDCALTYSLNTESSVDRLGWLNDDDLWCTTHTHSLQLWDCEGVTPYAKFERSDLSVVSQIDDVDDCYTVRFHPSNVLEHPFLLAGSSNVKGERLNCFNITNNQLEVCYNLMGNKQLVRDSWLHEQSGSLVTGGEGGFVNIWRQAETTFLEQHSSHKLVAKIGTAKGRDRHHRTKPY